MAATRIKFLVLLIGVIVVTAAQTDSTVHEISEKKAELSDKNVEVLELQSEISVHDAELQAIREEIQRLKQYNRQLRDSLLAKQSEVDSLKEQQNQVENFKLIVNTFDEDKALTEEILESIKSNNVLAQDADTLVQEVNDSEYRTQYNEALNLYFDRDYSASMERFRILLQTSRRHPLADNCQYWLGENLYSQEKYPQAVEAFQKVKPLGDGNKADAALFKIGLSYLKMNNQPEALAAFRRLEREFPNSELVEKARKYLTTQEKF